MKTGDAYHTLAEAMQSDPSYATTWQANIAMPILDGCAKRGAPMTHALANELADDLMSHLFGVGLTNPAHVRREKVKAAPGVAAEV